MSKIADLQPADCRAPLQPLVVRSRSSHAAVISRIIAYDPAQAYERIAETANPLQRIQTRREIGLHQLFPKKKDGFCDCGCGIALKGRQTRWADIACADFAWHVYAIIAGRRTEIKRCLKAYYGRRCGDCGKAPVRYKASNGRMRSGLEFDHIVPVHCGGGACWLSNFRPLCTECHKAKTQLDRKRRAEASLIAQ